jgi:hypothetical protein
VFKEIRMPVLPFRLIKNGEEIARRAAKCKGERRFGV